MSRNLILKKCDNCGAVVRVFADCNCHDCGIICCNNKMRELIPNEVEASVEKHVPTYEIKDDKIIVKINHVMEEKHHIEWLSLVSPKEEKTIYFDLDDKLEVEFDYVENAVLYAYCNLHGLWIKEIK